MKGIGQYSHLLKAVPWHLFEHLGLLIGYVGVPCGAVWVTVFLVRLRRGPRV
jgi:hypothetical protein